MNTEKSYKVASSGSLKDVVSLVNTYSDAGWEPIGGIQAVYFNGKMMYHQSIYKKPVGEKVETS